MTGPEPGAIPTGLHKGLSTPATLGLLAVLRDTALAEWQWAAGVTAGLIGAADRGGTCWSAAAVAEIVSRRAEILAAAGDELPIGAVRAAERLAERTGLAVDRADVVALAEAGVLAARGEYKGWPLYACRELDAVDVDALAAVVADRQAWVAASLPRQAAAERLGWRLAEFDRVAAARGITPGRFDRVALVDVDALADDEDLADEVRADRLLMANQAAEHLEIRETDFKYLVASDLLAPKTHTSVDVTRYRSVDVPLYRVGDLDALREHPDIDWEAVRSVRPGERSPLRELARRPVDRAALIRRWVAGLGSRHGIEVWAWWNNAVGQWEIDFERVDGGPSVADVKREIREHPLLRGHRRQIAVATEAGAVIRWARAMREPGAAVVLDTETTDLDGYVVEIGIVDACTGETLLDTLVNPGCAISDGARWVHGITDADVADAPPLADVWPQLLEVTRGRVVLAYNSDFDAGTLARHARRDGLALGHLGDADRWACLMNQRSSWQLCRRWLPLGGGHRALGDARTAFDLLCAMVTPAYGPKAAR